MDRTKKNRSLKVVWTIEVLSRAKMAAERKKYGVCGRCGPLFSISPLTTHPAFDLFSPLSLLPLEEILVEDSNLLGDQF